MPWSEYLRLMRDVVNSDVSKGDFVTLTRVDHGYIVYEKILTFSGLTIERRFCKNACDAKTDESQDDIRENHEEPIG